MSGFIQVVLASFFWALDTLFRYPLMGKGYDASLIVFYEHLFLVVIFLIPLIYTIKKILDAPFSSFLCLFWVGVIGSALSTIAFTSAFQFLNPSVVILLQKLQPLVAISLSAIILKEKLTKNFIAWGLLSLIGALTLTFDSWNGAFSVGIDNLTSKSSLTGIGLALFAVFGWGSSTVVGKKLTNFGFKSKEILSARYSLGLLALTPIVLLSDKIQMMDFSALRSVALIVLFSGVIGMFLYYRGLKTIKAKQCTIAELFFPLSSVILNWIFLSSPLGIMEIVGGALLIIGSTVIQYKNY